MPCGFRKEWRGQSGSRETSKGLVQLSRQDNGGLASGVAEGLDSRDILGLELAGFNKGDKIFVLTLEIQDHVGIYALFIKLIF